MKDSLNEPMTKHTNQLRIGTCGKELDKMYDKPLDYLKLQNFRPNL